MELLALIKTAVKQGASIAVIVGLERSVNALNGRNEWFWH